LLTATFQLFCNINSQGPWRTTQNSVVFHCPPLLTTIQRLLDHLKEAGFYSPKDLESIDHNLVKWNESVERGKSSHSPELMTLLEARIGLCRNTVIELQQSLSKLDPQMMGTYEKLVSILRSLSACNTRSKVAAFRTSRDK